MSQLAIETRKVLLSKVGVQEIPKGSNRGPDVDTFARRAGYKPPVYWCACFLFWGADVAAENLGIENPVPRTGSCDVLLDWARRMGYIVEEPEEDDWFLVMATKDDAVHCGHVLKPGRPKLRTLEGNSNGDGSANGYEVADRERSRSGRLVYIRWHLGAARGFVLKIGDKPTALDLELIAGANYAPVREVAKILGGEDFNSKIGWDPETPGVLFDGKLLPGSPVLRNGTAYLPVRSLAQFFGLKLDLDQSKKVITLDH